MISMSIDEIRVAVNGELTGNPATAGQLVTGKVSTDSRELEAGDVFVARPGEFTDGHNFLLEAQRGGAALAIVERADDSINLPQIEVVNATQALADLAKAVLAKARAIGRIKVVGITGSNGKTSTKNMLAAILSEHGAVIAPVASFNNDVGAPLTILRITESTDYLIVEMGASGPGSIARLAELTQPEVGIELKVGLAHAGVFGGLQETAAIKAELLPSIRSLTIMNFDDPNVMAMHSVTPVKTFGFDAGADLRISNPRVSINGTECEFELAGANYPVRLQVLGEHQLYNAAAAVLAAYGLGVSPEASIAALGKLELAERWRMQPMPRSDGAVVINDAYNASPDSMRAALQTLAILGRQGHRTVAVLGAMAELGELANDEHDAIGRLVVRYNIDQLFVLGDQAKIIHMAATQEGSWDGESIFIGDLNNAVAQINAKISPGDVVLVKSSNSAGLRFIGDTLAEA